MAVLHAFAPLKFDESARFLATTNLFSYAAAQITPMNKAIRFKLFLMMVWNSLSGVRVALIFGYLPSLGFSRQLHRRLSPHGAGCLVAESFVSEQALILNAFPIAAIIGMFFSNQFADRNFAAEKFLAFSHLVGGWRCLDWRSPSLLAVLRLMLVHCLLYVPTISITTPSPLRK